MRFNVNHIRSFRVALLLLVLFVEYVAGITLFMHSHIVDGDVVYHSHFYSGSSEAPNHSHSSQQAKLISALMFYVALAASSALALLLPFLRAVENVAEQCYEELRPALRVLSLRAPPAVM